MQKCRIYISRDPEVHQVDPKSCNCSPDSPSGAYRFTVLHSLSTVDSILDPENRLHLTTEEQLKTLLDQLDVVTSMRSSGGRTKRIRLLRREINALRQRMNQQQLNAQVVNGNAKKDHKEEAEVEEDREERDKVEVKKERKKGKKEMADNGPLTSASTPGTGEAWCITM